MKAAAAAAVAELVFIPSPGMGHLVPTLEIAKQLIGRDHRLSITVLIMNLPFDKSEISSSTESLLQKAADDRLKFLYLPQDEADAAELRTKSPGNFMTEFININKKHVRDHVKSMVSTESESHELTPIAGFVIDLFCTPMMDVATEFGVPSYVFFTSSAAFLCLMLHLKNLNRDDNQDFIELKDSDAELAVPGCVNPIPVKALPPVLQDKEGGSNLLTSNGKRLREVKGIMVNTFAELESHAVRYLAEDDNVPPVYPVGPILHVEKDDKNEEEAMKIMGWLDNQPQSSVVFLCFGSMGTFEQEQLKEIAEALERSGHRFLWSVRRPPPKGKIEYPSDYQDLNQILPEGFLERTADIGKVIGWAPQVAVLSHDAVGGFVSHCGWNSTLESLWCGVPVITWPMYAEQQMNAFQLVRELGLAVELTLDYKKEFMLVTSKVVLVKAEEIENAIRKLMERGNKCGEETIQKKVKEMSEKSKIAVVEGGSSYSCIGQFITDVINNVDFA